MGADLNNATFRNADLSGADLSGADLSSADLSNTDLSEANLSDASLSKTSLRNVDLSNANLSNADLSNANLGDADLSGANLSNVNLWNVNLSAADLRNARLPELIGVSNLFCFINDQLKAGGSVDMGSWHSCETAHCIAGWVITLAGDAGRVAETLIGTNAAAALIIIQSCPYLNGKVPDFYSDNQTAIEFINQCAAREKEIMEAAQ